MLVDHTLLLHCCSNNKNNGSSCNMLIDTTPSVQAITLIIVNINDINTNEYSRRFSRGWLKAHGTLRMHPICCRTLASLLYAVGVFSTWPYDSTTIDTHCPLYCYEALTLYSDSMNKLEYSFEISFLKQRTRWSIGSTTNWVFPQATGQIAGRENFPFNSLFLLLLWP